jgi:murein DD-endopeptidase MepM/ murein hydrolase activator NlpD
MPKKYFDFLIIPEGSSKKLSFRLSFWKTWIILGLLAFWSVALIVSTVFYGKAVSELISGKSLRQENERLKEYNAKVVDLERELQEYRKFAGRLAELAGVQHPFPKSRQETETILASVQTDGYVLEEAETDSTAERAEIAWMRSRRSFSGEEELQLESDSLRRIPKGQPIDGWITRGFSMKEHVSGGEHPGTDFAAKESTKVRVTADGTVSFVGWDDVYGNLAIVDHGNGYVTYYGHNSKILADSNSFVKRGEVIALSGNSGISSAPHLHYEIRKDNIPIDPKAFLNLK